jgi:hypothetical protein
MLFRRHVGVVCDESSAWRRFFYKKERFAARRR